MAEPAFRIAIDRPVTEATVGSLEVRVHEPGDAVAGGVIWISGSPTT